MTRKTIDFQGIVTLDMALIEQLNLYLLEKESYLGNCIANAIHTLPKESLPPVLPFSTNGVLKLSDAIDAFAKNIRQISNSKKQLVAQNDWELARRQTNNCLWEYVEILEGNVTEFFQQLNQVNFEHWHPQLHKVVENLYEILMKRLEEILWVIPRLERLLQQYKLALESKQGKWVFLSKVQFLWKPMLDGSLMSYVKKSERFLKNHYKDFDERYQEYKKLQKRIDQALQKFKRYIVFRTLEESYQNNFLEIYKLIRIWGKNEKSKSLPEREPVRALRSAFSIDKVYEIFNIYYQYLEKTLYERSRLFKKEANSTFSDKLGKPKTISTINVYLAEINTLGATISKYREFYLRTHPNPYIRSRLGFSEWIVGPEPSQTKRLLDLEYKAQKLDELFNRLKVSVEEGPKVLEDPPLSSQYREIKRTLHELGQPLTSRTIMRSKAEKLLLQIELLNELGSFNPHVVDYVQKILSKAIRADWQFHVLFEFPLFHELYEIHRGIIGEVDNRQHLNRKLKFKQILKELTSWVEARDTHRHVYEVEQDMTDIKGYLQEFLGDVQRLLDEKSINKKQADLLIHEISKELLQYRYMFGQFFYFLHQHEPEGKIIRNQFLFVDQYFETIESKIKDLQASWNLG